MFIKKPLAEQIGQRFRNPVPSSSIQPLLLSSVANKPSGFSAALGMLASSAAIAETHSITYDANFTNISSAGSTHSVTSLVTNVGTNSAINVFDNFVVGDTHTVNLQIPDTASKLVNIVRGSDTPAVHGILNSYQSGALGGEVVFASSNGFLVGQSGVVNVGKLVLRTPSALNMAFLLDGNNANTDVLRGVIGKAYSVSESGTVTINGKVNTANGVDIHANKISVSDTGKIISGNAKAATYVDYSNADGIAAVNAGGLNVPDALIADNSGGLLLTATGSTNQETGYDISIDGDLYADAGITISAKSISLGSTSTLDTENKNSGVSNWQGDITLTALTEDQVGLAQATASTNVQLNGTIKTNDLIVSATSKATSSFYEGLLDPDNPGDFLLPVASVAMGAFTGLSGYAVLSDADAKVEVNSGANISATGYVDLNAESQSISNAPSLTLSGTLFGIATIYGDTEADSTVRIAKGAKVHAEGDLSLTAHNEALLSASALTAVASDNANFAGALAIGDADVNANAIIESGADLDANNLTVSAENQNSFYVGASAYGLTNQKFGAAVAVGTFNTKANAQVGANLGSTADHAGNIAIKAIDRTEQQRVHSGASVGANLLFRTLSPIVGGLASFQNGVNSYYSSKLGQYFPSGDLPNENNQLSFKAGGAFSLNLGEKKAFAGIGTYALDEADTLGQLAPSIIASGNVAVIADTDLRNYRTSSEASVNSQPYKDASQQNPSAEKALALAINAAIQNSEAVAEIGDYVNIDASKLAVHAEQRMPIVSDYENWNTFGKVVGRLNGIAGLQNNLLTTFANAGAEADHDAFGGSFNLLINDTNTKAWVGDKTIISLSGNGAWDLDSILRGNSSYFADQSKTWSFASSSSILARNQIESINIAGNTGPLLLLPGGSLNKPQDGDKGKGVGGSISYIELDSDAIAGIGDAKIINSSGELSVAAVNADRHWVITPSSGKTSGAGFNGILGVLNMDNTTHASISVSAELAVNTIALTAEQSIENWAAAGAFNYSDQDAVGVAIAVNVSEGDTKAYIGDNDEDENSDEFSYSAIAPTRPTDEPDITAGLTIQELTVTSRSFGTAATMAVSGAVTGADDGEPGILDKTKSSLANTKVGKALSSAFSKSTSNDNAASINNAAAGGETGTPSSSEPTVQAPNENQSKLTAAGSGTFTYTNMDATASIDGAIINTPTADDTVNTHLNALNKLNAFSMSGAAGLALADPTNQTQRSSVIAGAIAYQLAENEALATIKNTTITNAQNVAVNAALVGEKTTVGLGLAINKDTVNTSNSQNAGFSISGATVRDRASATIENSTITAKIVDGTSSDLDVNAYNNTHVGLGGGALYWGGKQGAGLAVTWADINDSDEGAAINAKIDEATLTNFDTIDVNARNLSRIGIGAAGIGYSDQFGASGYMGSFAISNIGSSSHAIISNSTLTGSDIVNVTAIGSRIDEIDTLMDTLSSQPIDSGYDFTGASVLDNTEVVRSESGDASTIAYDSEGARIIAVAGVVQINSAGGGSSNAGLSYVHSEVNTEKVAHISNTSINAGADEASSITVTASEDTDIYNISLGVGVAQGSYSGVGSVAVAEINNEVRAEIGNWNDSTASGTINSGALSVQASNAADIFSLAGAVGVSKGVGSAGGLSASLNLIGNDTHSTTAHISNVSLENAENITVSALSGTENNENLYIANAIAAGLSTSGGGSAYGFAGAITTSNVDQTIDSGIKNVGTNHTGTIAQDSEVSVTAHDYTDSVATAWSLATSADGALGVAVATNRVDSDVTAEILGDGSNASSSNIRAGNVIVDAQRDNWLLAIDAGVALSDDLGIAPSIGTGVVDGTVTARISDQARVFADRNVIVNAEANTTNLVGSGAVGVGLDTGAGALAVSTSIEAGLTQAYILNSDVSALGKGAGYAVNSGDLIGQTALPDLSKSGEGSDDTVELDDLTTGFSNQSLEESTETIHGLAVNATSYQKQRAITVAGSGSKQAALTVNVSTNSFQSSTNAYIQNSEINTDLTDSVDPDALVRANNHSFGLGVAAGLAIAIGGEDGSAGAGVAGVAMNLQDKNSSAKIINSNVNANDLSIDANSTQVAQAVSAGVATGIGGEFGLGAAASVVVTAQNGDNTAWLNGGTITADSVLVNADTRQEANVAAGSVGIGSTVGVGIGLAVNLVGGNTRAMIGRDINNDNDTTETLVKADAVDVNADRLEAINSYAFGAGASADKGVAAMIDVSEITGETRAGVYGRYDTTNSKYSTQVLAKDGTSKAASLTVSAQEILNANHIAMGLGIGSNVGVGAVANVILGRSQVYSELVGSDVKSSELNVNATASRETDMISVAGGAGSLAGAISLGLVLMGDGDTTTDDGGSASEEFSDSRTAINTMLGEDLASNNAYLTQEEKDALNAQSQQQASEVEGQQAAEDAAYASSGTVLKLSGESATAARISGGSLDVGNLNVSSESIWHNYTGIGAASVSSTAGLGGGLGITYLYDINSAIVDADVTANNINITATTRDQADDAVAAEMKNYVIGASGGTAVGISYSDARSENRVVAGLKRATGNDTGNLTISASDTTQLRIGDISADDTEDGENFAANPTTGNMNINIGSGAVGASVAIARKNSDVDAWLGEFDGVNRTLVDGYVDQSVFAESSGQLKSTAFAASGGIGFALQGVVTDSRDRSQVNATVAGEIDVAENSSLRVNATAIPETFANAFGVTISAVGAAGGSFSYSIVETDVGASVTDATKFTGSGSVSIEAVTGRQESDYQSAIAGAFAASGGLKAALSASEAEAYSASETVAEVGDFVTLPLGDLSVTATSRSKQLADANGYFIGTYSAGANFSSAESQTSTRVKFGADPIAAGARLGDISLLANSIDENQGFTTAGGGGVVSGSAAVSHADASDSAGKRASSVDIANWSDGYRSAPVGAGKVQVEANHQTFFFAGTTSLTVSVVGGSGAWSDADVDLNSELNVGENVSFFADEIGFSASNKVDQINTPWFGSDFTPSVQAGGGGAINGSAALSDVDISRLNSTINIGDNSVFQINALADLLDPNHNLSDYTIKMDAFTGYNLYDSVVLKVYGALQGAGAESEINVDTHNSVNIGSGTRLINPVSSVELGAYTRGYATSDASVTVGAAIGIAGGVSKVDLDTENEIELGDDVEIESYDAAKILAGRSADYLNENLLDANALANLYNYTAVPLDVAKTANAYASVSNNIHIGDGVKVNSVRDIILEANRGVLRSSGKGLAVDTYDVLLSTSETFGNGFSGDSEHSTIWFNGNSEFVAGTRFQQSVHVDQFGTITKGINTIATAENYGNYSSRESLQAYLDDLNAEKAALLSEPTGINVDDGTFNDTDDTDNDATASGSGETQTIGSNASRIDEINEEIVFLTPFLERLSDTVNNAILVGGISASGGNVDLKAKNVVVQSGSPSITANGNPEITITNNSNSSLIIDNLLIPNVSGGSVFVTGDVKNNLPTELNIFQSGSDGESKITISHSPSISDGADVILQGSVSNLGGTVKIDVLKGDLIQTGSILAKTMEITAPEGGYLLNEPSKTQAYGFSPTSLTGFTDTYSQWKPASADEMVMYYINARYGDEIAAKGSIAAFNAWWYGTDYLFNPEGGDKDLRVYLNWGFSDADECGLYSNCTSFSFPNNAGGGSRGNGSWRFDSISDVRSELLKTATYQQVKNAGYGDNGNVALDAQYIGINAYNIDINGTIRAGAFNNWSVEVGEGFDSAIERFVNARGLSSGSTINLSPGEKLSWYEDNPDYTLTNLLTNPFIPRRIRVEVDPQLTILNGNDAGINLSYKVGSGEITVDNINASGNGYVSLRGRLMSTGPEGKVLVDDGFGSIDIVNRSTKELVVNDINAGGQSTGVIRITDLNYRGADGRNFSKWLVHNPGQSIEQYITSSDATSYRDATATTVGGLVDGKQSYTYDTKKGQVYYYSQREEVKRSFEYKRKADGSIDGYISLYDPSGEWAYDSSNPIRPDWNVVRTSISSCAALSSVACNADGSVKDYLTHVIDDRYKSSRSLGYSTSYSNYYGSAFTAIDWDIISPTYIALESHTYVKADHPILFQFIGNDSGSINIDSRTGMQLNGVFTNSSGVTDLSVDRSLGSVGSISDAGNIVMSSVAYVNSDKTYLNAAGSLGSELQSLNILTDLISATAQTGSVNLDIAAAGSNISVEKLHAGSGINITADQSLVAYGSGLHISGDDINITSEYGSIGNVSSNDLNSQALNINAQGLLTLNAAGDIALNQANGDMFVNTIESERGDVSITLQDGNLINGIGVQGLSDEEIDYQAQVWDRLDLRSDSAGADNVRAYENQVSGQYHSYWLIKERLDDDSNANFTINAQYIDVFKARYKAREDALNGSDLDINAISDAQVTDAVRDEYQSISTWLSEQQIQGLVENTFDLGSSYDRQYRYAVTDGSDAYNTLTSGARWSDSQLEITISNAALEPTTETYITDRAANITGNNVTLDIQSGRLGEDLDTLVFSIDYDDPTISNEQKSALLRAGPGDLQIESNNTGLAFRVKQQDPLKVNALGGLSLKAAQQIYLESDLDLNLLEATSAGGGIRLTASGNINSLSGSATTISGDKLNISSRTGYIGSELSAVNIDIVTALQNASAAEDIWLNQINGPLAIGSIGTAGHLNLNVGGNITNFADNFESTNVLANSASINAQSNGSFFDIGESGRQLKVSLANGMLSVSADNAYLLADSNSGLDISTVDLAGNLGLSSESDLRFNDDINAGGVAVQTTETMMSSQANQIITSGALTLIAQDLDLELSDIEAGSAYLESDSDIRLSTLQSDGDATLLARNSVTVDGSISANSNANIAAGNINLSAATLTAGNVVLDAINGNVVLSTVDSASDINILATGNVLADVSIESDALTAITAANINLSAASLTAGNVDLDATDGNVALASVTSQTDANIAATGDVTLSDELLAGSNIEIEAANFSAASGSEISGENLNIEVANFTQAESATIVNAREGLTIRSGRVNLAGQTLAGNSLSITSETGNLILNNVKSGNASNLFAAEDLDLNGNLISGDNVNIDAKHLAMQSGSNITAEGLINVETEFDMLVSELVSASNTAGAIQLTSAAGSILAIGNNAQTATFEPSTFNEDSLINISAQEAGASVLLSAATGIGNPLVIDTPWLSASTDSGDINIIARSSLRAELLNATNGNIHLATFGDLTIDELTGTPWLWVDGFLVADRMRFSEGELRAKDGISVADIQLNEGGPLGVYAPTIDMNIEGNGQRFADLSLGGFNIDAYADLVELDINNIGQIRINELRARASTINTNQDIVFNSAFIENTLDITSGQLSISLDNANAGAKEVDAQLMSPFGEFWLDIAGVKVRTDAQITRFQQPVQLEYKGAQSKGGSRLGSIYGLSAEYERENSTQQANVAPRRGSKRPVSPTSSFEQFDSGVLDEVPGASELNEGFSNPAEQNDFEMEIQALLQPDGSPFNLNTSSQMLAQAETTSLLGSASDQDKDEDDQSNAAENAVN